MSTHPVRLDRLQAGIVAWLSAAIPSASVVWAPTGFPRAAEGPLVVTARLLAPPSASPLGGASTPVRMLPTSATVRVLAATAGAGVILRVSGRRWEILVPALATVESVRDALLDAVGEDPMVSATFVAGGTSRIVITPTTLGDLYGVSITSDVEGMAEVEAMPTTLAEVQLSDVRAYVEIQAWSQDATPRGGAAAALSRLETTRKLQATREVLDVYGLSIIGGVPAPVELDALSGPAWTSRASVSLYIGQIAIAAAAIVPVERVRGTLHVPPVAAVDIDSEPPEPPA